MKLLPETDFVSKNIESFIKTAVLFFIFYACYLIFKPFLMPLIWGAIIAIWVFPLHKKLSKLFGGRSIISAILITIFFLLLFIIPSAFIINSLSESINDLSSKIYSGAINLDDVQNNLKNLPIIGKPINDLWVLFTKNTVAGVQQYKEVILNATSWLFSSISGLTSTLILFVVSIIVAGLILSVSKNGYKKMNAIMVLLVGDGGIEMAETITKTVQSVVNGVLGTAVIQSIIISIGLFIFHVPAAAIISVAILFLAIIQLPVILVTLPLAIYMFTISSGLSASIFALWMIIGGASDNIIKPFLLGRGVKTPMIVILIGSIGGMLLMGILGLFVGAVVLAVAYQLLSMWTRDIEDQNENVAEIKSEENSETV